MAVSSQLVAAIGFLAAGWLLQRWAARHDIRSWVVDALWRAVLRRDWRAWRSSGLTDLLDRDAALRGRLSGKLADIKADQERYGARRASAKHGALVATAYAASWAAGLVMLMGALMLAHAIYRDWS